MSLIQSFESFLTRHSWTRVFVAYSGGLDSQTLLHLAARTIPKKLLCALHVNHGLSESADEWQSHCQNRCLDFGVQFQAVKVNVENTGEGLEAAARKARYEALAQFLQDGDLLLAAHHQDDQIETFMLRLLRGSGLDGLASMSETRPFGAGTLGRPMLNHTRAEVMSYADEQGISWVEDESNQDSRFDRNYLRNQLFPVLEKRWPMYRKTIARSIGHIQEVGAEHNTKYQEMLDHRQTYQGGLKVVGFEELTDQDAFGLIRHWLRSCNLEVPSSARLTQILENLIYAKADANPIVEVGEYSVRRFQSAIFAVPTLPPIENQHVQLLPEQTIDLVGAGRLSLVLKTAGTAPNLIATNHLPLQLRYRIGGETMHPAGRNAARDLKRLFQEYRLEPWWRDRIPLLYAKGIPVAVGGLFVCEGFQAQPGEPGYAVVWEPPQLKHNLR